MPIKSRHITSNNIIMSISEDGTLLLKFIGTWKAIDSSKMAKDIITILEKSKKDDIAIVDLSGIKSIDTIGAVIIVRLREKYQGNIEFKGASASVNQMISIVSFAGLYNDTDNNYTELRKSPNTISRIYSYIGESISTLSYSFLDQMHILGLMTNNLCELIASKRKIKEFIPAFTTHLHHIGVKGAPVIILISLITGAVIAQQAAFQLANFGAEIFSIDLISVLQLREIGVLLTAVMIAGRSGSAIAAEIGAMKINSELDAIKVMGIDIVSVIMSPRIFALIISLPLLTILANISSIIGASVIIWKYYNMPFNVFFTRLHSTQTLLNICAGLLKAPFMAAAIGIIAFKEGLKVKYDANSIGNTVTACVVKSISMVLIIDSLFAVFYFAIGI
ncbi:MlaE family ABC transporter permease [Candidatus Liberibacter americanus]|uniref:ABC-type toluene export system protein n=1 Tax=Candidatus Liberibacter americanus str. Sao Paulo TaxID=1261131 RepID=U6B4K5_9HYPH|nr:ABC transporter permease [Candidatus Liberibacter americanus]AHA27825.1 ABC-type toluene export system protein [Candidatus Liberibacter americanus str. Sao Paulo]EMS35992.1 ABC transporter [Candidatus Liberibacter americanus PW_SP]